MCVSEFASNRSNRLGGKIGVRLIVVGLLAGEYLAFNVMNPQDARAVIHRFTQVIQPCTQDLIILFEGTLFFFKVLFVTDAETQAMKLSLCISQVHMNLIELSLLLISKFSQRLVLRLQLIILTVYNFVLQLSD